MSLWLIQPRDPLIFGDGKPFTAIPGTRARSLAFPYPSTVAGSLRTRAGLDPATGRFDTGRIEEVKQKKSRGPLLVEIDSAESISQWLFPAPADALMLRTDDVGTAQRFWLCPMRGSDSVWSNLDGLTLLGADETAKGKPHPSPPLFWNLDAYMEWLKSPRNGGLKLEKLGHSGPERERRTHVSVSADSQTAVQGALFQTSGIEFGRTPVTEPRPQLSGHHRLALAVDTDAEMRQGLGFLGGESRLVRWKKTEAGLPQCPDGLREAIVDQKSCRVVLATPGHFETGHLPSWLLRCTTGVRAGVEAARVGRYRTVSGWDYEKRRPKPTRRLCPAGSVYFLSLQGAQEDLHRWVDAVWMNSVSDDEQSRLDGFGLATLGQWEGTLRDLR